MSRLWSHPLFQYSHKKNLSKEIFSWRRNILGSDRKTPLVTVLSHNNLEDKISLVLVPLLASAGLRILKPIWRDELSGQALLNNLLSIPGITLPSNPEDIDRLLEFTGGAYSSLPESGPLYNAGSAHLAADEFNRFKVHSLFILYAVDWDGIAMDIRVRDFSNQIKAQNAQELVMDLREQCDAARIGFSCFITTLKQPLGYALGPVLELQEALDVLKAKGPLDFTKLAIEQGADLLLHAGKYTNRIQAKSFLKKQLQNGAALDRFREIIQAQGGTEEVTDERYPFPLAKRNLRILSNKEGYVHRIDMDRLINLNRKLCSEDKGAGLLVLKNIGDTTEKNDMLAQAYLPSSWIAQDTKIEVRDIFSISQFPPRFQPLIAEKIKGSFRF